MEIDQRVAMLFEAQYGVASVRQLLEHDVDRHARARRVRAGLWEPATPRVMRLAGTPRSPEQLLMTGVLNAGPRSAATHDAAGWIWKLPGCPPAFEASRGRSHGDSVAARGHRPRYLPEEHRTTVRGIPCATLPRTIFDLAGMPRHAGRMPALVRTVVNRSPAMLPALHRMLEELAKPGRPGIRRMRAILHELPPGTNLPESGLEARFDQICRNAGIRGLERQVDVGGHSWLGRVDFVIRELGLLIEVDSVLFHTSPADVARDTARDQAMLAAGWRKVLRISEEDIWRRPWHVIDQVRAAIDELRAAA